MVSSSPGEVGTILPPSCSPWSVLAHVHHWPSEAPQFLYENIINKWFKFIAAQGLFFYDENLRAGVLEGNRQSLNEITTAGSHSRPQR